MSIAADVLLELSSVAGPGAVRDARDEDVIDGVRPARVVEPPTAEALAAVLAWCSTHRQSVVVRGGGTKLTWGRRPAPIDVALTTRALPRAVRHEPGDLTVSVDAGTSLAELNRELARQGQWLPVDVSDDRATVGGAIATNDSGPLRHRYGTPRDQLIGIRLATADGRLATSGGNVVKNVAGYDLGKLVAGSFGSLAVIVNATFKLAPLPAMSATLTSVWRERTDLASAAAAIAGSQLDPLSVEVDALATPGAPATLRLFVRFAGVSAAVEDQLRIAESILAATGPSETARVTGDADGAAWHDPVARFWARPGAIIKAAWMPASLADVLGMVEDVARDTGGEIELMGRAAMGSGLIRVSGDSSAEIAAVRRFRSAGSAVGHVQLARSSAELKSHVDVWDVPDGIASVSRLLKQAMDPAGVLNAARGPA